MPTRRSKKALPAINAIAADTCYSPGQNPRVANFLSSASASARYPVKAFSADVRAGKGTPFYRAHTYHTKVPPQGIEKFIEHYTKPGQLVLDPFCGSGMTGIAAIRQGRRALLSDLSPAATFFAYNHSRKLDVSAFKKFGLAIAEKLEKEYGWLYDTINRETGDSVQFTTMIWSQTFLCPACGKEYSLWDAALDDERSVRTHYPCPHCREIINKKDSIAAASVPVAIQYGYAGQATHNTPVQEDLALLRRVETMAWPKGLWHPTDPISHDGDELKRLLKDGVHTVDQLFTRRSLLALSLLWREALQAPEDVRSALMFTVTGIVQRASRLIKYIPALNMSPGPIHGTMYIPSFYPEVNVFNVFRRKLTAVAKSHKALAADLSSPRSADDLCVSTQSATDLSNIPDESIDYVFTDPPFGSNIQYSELNILWESWLGVRTDTANEAVMNRSQRKGVADYAKLMGEAFREIRRVLRRGAWLTLVFHNSSGEVWAAIQNALAEAGFAISAIHTFDKAHDTFKMVTAPGAVGYDVVVNCRKTRTITRRAETTIADIAAARRFLDECTVGGSVAKSPRRLHAEAIAYFMTRNMPIGFDYKDFRLLIKEMRV